MENKQVRIIVIQKDDDGQRLDNYIRKICKGVPLSRIYRAVRTGEIRVNKGRVKAFVKLREGDALRLPPLRIKEASPGGRVDGSWVKRAVVYEDDRVMVLDKPDNMPVHKGSGADVGVVDCVKAYWGTMPYLVHRLDKMVSGCLLLVKGREDKKAILARWLHEGCHQRYEALVCGEKPLPRSWMITHALADDKGGEQEARSRCVRQMISQEQKIAKLGIEIATGRKHQSSRHLALYGLPVVGDKIYGDFAFNRGFSKQYGEGLYLHAAELVFWHPEHGWQTVATPWPEGKLEKIRRIFR